MNFFSYMIEHLIETWLIFGFGGSYDDSKEKYEELKKTIPPFYEDDPKPVDLSIQSNKENNV